MLLFSGAKLAVLAYQPAAVVNDAADSNSVVTNSAAANFKTSRKSHRWGFGLAKQETSVLEALSQ